MKKKIKLTIITWSTHISMLKQAAQEIDVVVVDLFSSKEIEGSPTRLSSALESIKQANAVLLYRSTEKFWAKIEEEIRTTCKSKPVISLGSNPSSWLLSTVEPEIVATCYSYILYAGKKNFRNLLLYIASLISRDVPSADPPVELPWYGFYHPSAPDIFRNPEEYLAWYGEKKKFFVGVLFSRHYWVNENCEIIDALVKALEKRGIGVAPVFTYGGNDKNLDTKSGAEIIREYFVSGEKGIKIDALIKLTPLYGNSYDNTRDITAVSTELFKELNVPVFQPILTSYKTVKEWEADPHGLGSLTAWYVTMPEFEGVIEPIMLAAAQDDGTNIRKIMPIDDRCEKIAERVLKWIELRHKPISQRKIAFILHNNPCASVEATIGSAANLDSIESVVRILKRMKEVGYNITPPSDSDTLIKTIMERKAISEFRWTTVDEIVAKGGYLKLISVDEYNRWFSTLAPGFKKRITEVWGAPPGQEINGVPAAMVFQDKIVVTGIQYGNAVICIQPKRGCAGARCDGQVCKILHDPDIPPPHQYFATYRYLEYDFKVDCIVHIGTHGNLEFLPGKGVGLSQECCPDLAIGHIPHLYIYNADNPPEGAIAKRRSYATLIDHMQAVMVKSGTPAELENLERLIGEYYEAKRIDKVRAHQLQHLILHEIKKANLLNEIKYSDALSFDEVVKRTHEVISLIKNSQINDGLHIFGQIPQGHQRTEYIRAIFNADTDDLSLRSAIFELLGLDLSYALTHQGDVYMPYGVTYAQILEYCDYLTQEFITEVLRNKETSAVKIIKSLLKYKIKNNNVLERFQNYANMIWEIYKRIENSQEIEALLSGFDGNYIPVGPSGKITRGRYDVLPTGRNFYTLDLRRLPTKAAYNIGQQLAQGIIDKHLKEENRFPENVAIYWTCMDITCSDGETMAQIMALLGVEPIWDATGRVNGFEIIPLKKLKRPRIDVTVRIGGILRDNFWSCVEYVDDIIRKVASLDESTELNFIRKHTLEQVQARELEGQNEWEEVTTRIFGSKPGTYMAGVNLAVYASAWRQIRDLTDVFVYWNQYAYGRRVFGKKSPRALINNLKTVDITFNKTYTDEYDLFGCCCHFATHGGLTAAARVLSGKEVKAYYGDTRDMKNIGVRDLADEVRRVVRSKLLNPKWIEGMKRHKYKGLGDISKRIGRVYGWAATTEEVDDWIFDEIARTYVLEEDMRRFFEENNPWALEEIGRRLLEAAERGLWNADPEILEDLKSVYLEIEGWMEEKSTNAMGEFQGGAIDVLTSTDVKAWQQNMEPVKAILEDIIKR